MTITLLPDSEHLPYKSTDMWDKKKSIYKKHLMFKATNLLEPSKFAASTASGAYDI